METPGEHNPGLADRRCVVTGASSGIGQTIALALVSVGAEVSGVARRREQLEATAKLAQGPGRFAAYPADLTVDEQLGALGDELLASNEGIHVLVHSAGMFSRDPIGTAPIEDFDRQYRINIRAPYLLTQTLLPALRRTKGQIIFINSSVVFGRPRTNISQYSATQYALRSFANTLREEVNADGIRVVSIYLGRTATQRQARIHSLEGKPYAPERLVQPTDVADIVLKVLTVPWTAEITDLRVRPTLKS
jgi:NADP-dependent 3-hydroxy acid dehydrogenase YdfG